MTMEKKPAAPSPEVVYLTALFRRIQQGSIRVPAFQRGFVWRDGQVIELLESIYYGYPIGSLLMWNVDQPLMRCADASKSYFPDLPLQHPTTFILDGLQRLSTLYAVFHFDKKLHPSKFDIHFDLKKKGFVTTSEPAETHIPLNVVFRANEFVKYHSSLSKLDRGPVLVDTAVDLLATFQEYLVPTVTIVERDVTDVVRIFERINSTGTRLSAVDFMRAVTWSSEFDLNSQLHTIREFGRAHGFDIPNETLVKVFAIALGHSPASESMLHLRKLDSERLRGGTNQAKQILVRIFEFVKSALHIHTYDLIPYEAQFLALAGFFSTSKQPDGRHIRQIVRWYWTASLNEDMQGRSEHQVARIVEQMQALRAGKRRGLLGRLSLTTSTLMERRFRWGTALSSALASMLAQNQCRSFVSGEVIPVEDYMTGDAGKNYVPVVPTEAVQEIVHKSVPGGKIVANMIVASNGDLANLGRGSALELVKHARTRAAGDAILESQFIPPSALQALRKNRYADFLQERANCILAFAQQLTLPPSQRPSS